MSHYAPSITSLLLPLLPSRLPLAPYKTLKNRSKCRVWRPKVTQRCKIRVCFLSMPEMMLQIAVRWWGGWGRGKETNLNEMLNVWTEGIYVLATTDISRWHKADPFAMLSLLYDCNFSCDQPKGFSYNRSPWLPIPLSFPNHYRVPWHLLILHPRLISRPSTCKKFAQHKKPSRTGVKRELLCNKIILRYKLKHKFTNQSIKCTFV